MRVLTEEALLITDRVNLRWLHHLPMAQGAIYLSPLRRVFLTWGRGLPANLPTGLTAQAIQPAELGETVRHLLAADGQNRIQVEDTIPLVLAQQLQAISDLQVDVTHGLVEIWRDIKDPWEVDQLAEACRITEAAFEHVLPLLRPGHTELEVAAELEHAMRLQGCEEFNKTIVAAGLHSAKPHHWPDRTVLQTGDFVTMDYGCTFNGYHSDMTRTVVLGKATREQRRIYQTVLLAQQEAEKALRAGRLNGELDAIARQVIEDAGYHGRFLHNLGHGIGLDIHEGTGLTQGGTTPLRTGMVVSVEPGIYIEGLGGVRIEDIALVEEAGCRILENTERELIEI